MSAVLALVWLIGIGTSLWFLLRPSKTIRIFGTRKRSALTAVAIFFGLPIIGALVGINSHKSALNQPAVSSNPIKTGVDNNSSVAEGAKDTQPASTNWTYDESHDDMRGTTTKYARTQSNEEFENSFGMGDEKVQLEIQKRTKRYEVDISNSNLQFTCNSFSETRVSVKFDNGPIEKFGCTDAVGDKFGVAFINSEDRFIAKLRRSKHVVIEAEVFQRGETQMSFDVSGLDF